MKNQNVLVVLYITFIVYNVPKMLVLNVVKAEYQLANNVLVHQELSKLLIQKILLKLFVKIVLIIVLPVLTPKKIVLPV
jgi:hypothetical protein